MDDILQMELIKGIKVLAGTDHEAFFTEWLVSICQCSEKNLQLIKFYERLTFFPESVKALEPHTGLTMDDLRPFCGFNDLAPTTLEEIVSLDQILRQLLYLSLNKKEDGTWLPSVDRRPSKTHHRKKIKRLRIIITEQERLINSLKKRLQKSEGIDPRMR
ncbi:MAG: hypothetical protein ACE5FZ_09635 [Nitrospiria bacterium]